MCSTVSPPGGRVGTPPSENTLHNSTVACSAALLGQYRSPHEFGTKEYQTGLLCARPHRPVLDECNTMGAQAIVLRNW